MENSWGGGALMTTTFYGDTVEVRLYTADERQPFGPSLDVLVLNYATARPGGCHGMTVGIVPVPGDFWQPFAHVTVTVNGVVVWEGRVNPPRYEGRWITGFSASGYGFAALEDQPYFSTDTTEVTSGSLLEAAIADAAPAVVYGPSDDPAGTDVAARYDRMTVKAMLEVMVAKGTAEGKPLDWFVWPRQPGHVTPHLVLRDGTPPAVASYHVGADDVSREPRDGDLWGRVWVAYTATNTGVATILSGNTDVTVTHGLGITPALDEIKVTPGGDVQWWVSNRNTTTFRINASAAVGADTDFGWTVTIPDELTNISPAVGFHDRYGVDRRIILNGGSMTTAAAEQYRDAQAALLNTRRFATTIQRDGGRGLASPSGSQTRHFSQPRADEWVYDTDKRVMLPIIATTVDPLAGTLDVVCGDQRDDYLNVWRNTQRSTKRRRENRNDNSGSFERRG